MALFKGGIPTGVDVSELLAAFELAGGVRVAYSEIEKALGLKRDNHRFRTVTNAWRKHLLRNNHLPSIAEGGEFIFLTADEAHDHSKSGLRRLGRAAGRLAVRVDIIDQTALSGERREEHRLLQRETAAVLEQVRKSAKAITPPTIKATNLRIAK